MGDRTREGNAGPKEEPKEKKLEKTMDQAEGELDTVEEALEIHDSKHKKPEHQRG